MRKGDPRLVWILVLLIVLVGWGIRVWYAAEAPRAGRFVDEKYSLLNIRAIVTEGTLEPASSYYPYPLFNVPPAALVAGSQALFDWTGDPRFEALMENRFGAPTYLLTRLVQTLYGALGLFLTYLVGRRIFSWEVGLIGALALAFMPWHIHASGYFKPDAQLVAMVLLAFYLSLEALESPTWKRYLLAGLGIALAMSTKLTGGVIAIPLVVGTFASEGRDKRRVGLVAVAGLASAAVFVLLNPYWRFYPTWLAGLERDYAMRAARMGMTRWQVPGRVGELITDPYTLGPWLGTLGLVAFVVLLVLLIVPGQQSPQKRAARWMLVSFPLAFSATYAWKTAYFKDNNFLPLIPFFCLLTGWALLEIWKSAQAVWPALRGRWVRVAGGVSICLMLMLPGMTYTYRSTTPTTMDRALSYLARRMRPPTGRVVLVEDIPVVRPIWEGGRRFGRGRSRLESVEDWQVVSEASFDRADASIFRPGSRESNRVDRIGRRDVRTFESHWFRSRGPGLIAVLHAWDRFGKPLALPVRRCRPNKRCLAAKLPSDVTGQERITLVVTLGFARGQSVEDVTRIQVGGREFPLFLASRTERGAIFMTDKLVVPEGAATAVFVARKELLRKGRFGIELHRWRRSGA